MMSPPFAFGLQPLLMARTWQSQYEASSSHFFNRPERIFMGRVNGFARLSHFPSINSVGRYWLGGAFGETVDISDVARHPVS